MYISSVKFSGLITGFCFIALLTLSSYPVLAAPKNATPAPAPKKGSGIVKWVDEKGITHYGDTLPPQYAGQSSGELTRQGRLIKPSNAQTDKAAAKEIEMSEEQKRHDSALLAGYTTAQEFDLARDRNLQTDEAAIQGLDQRMSSVKERLAVTQKTADSFNQRKKPIPPHVAQDMKEKQDEIAKIEAEIAVKQKNMEVTRQRFDNDKQRFIELKRDPSAPPPPVTPAPIAAPVATPAPVATSVPSVAAPIPEPVKPVPTMTAAPKAPKPAPLPVAAKPYAATKKPAPAAAPASATPTAKPAPAPAAPIPAAQKPATEKPAKKIKRVVMP